ncbi:MAG TPA: hypothetical protein VKE95_16300 [Burkholderiales bacterium]|nr:hypothetical protein [Burkholderiales bacterium]
MLAAPAAALAQERAFDPQSVYQEQSIHGFTVLVNPQVLAQARAVDVRAELVRQFEEVVDVVPSPALSALRNVRIWVEWSKRPDAGAEFHPSQRWLEQNGYNPAKAGAIEISNSLNFVSWSRAEQPCMVLHELAHAYHFLVLGENHPEIAAAYRQAVERGLYESVDYVGGGKRRAYALVNEKEYFAELSEAYFGRNDYYPFTRADLQRHDPVGYALVQRLWGNAANRQSVALSSENR